MIFQIDGLLVFKHQLKMMSIYTTKTAVQIKSLPSAKNMKVSSKQTTTLNMVQITNSLINTIKGAKISVFSHWISFSLAIDYNNNKLIFNEQKIYLHK